MERHVILHNDARELNALIAAGQRAAALDGRHLLSWGLAASLVLALQYAAEMGDWLPSRILWLWQPVALTGFVLAIFAARRGAGRRLGHPVARAYALAFAGAGAALLLYLLIGSTGGQPGGWLTMLLVTLAFGAAFLATGLATPLRWMVLPGLAWLALAGFYAMQGAVVPVDWLRLALAFALLLALPGAVLIARAPR